MSGLKNSKVAVIGGGMAGLAATKSLLAEGFSVTIFESRRELGGVWTGEGLTSDGDGLMYDGLETNVARSMMTFTDQPWSVDTPLSPPNNNVKQYLQCYANDIQRLPDGLESLTCYLGTQVIDVRYTPGSGMWTVDTQTNNETAPKAKHFPSSRERGRDRWNAQHPGTILHSSQFQSAEFYRGKNVLIVGKGPSGLDISTRIHAFTDNVVVSTRSDGRISDVIQYHVGPIESFDASDMTVNFQGGITLRFDYIIYCTGFLYDFPFLSRRNEPLFERGIAMPDLFQHIFYKPMPTLAFVGLPKLTVTFMVAEAQSAVVARVFSRRLPCPTAEEMELWGSQVRSTEPNMMMVVARGLLTPDQYINRLSDWSSQATDFRRGPDISEKLPPYYCTGMVNAQAVAGDARARYMAHGSNRFQYTTYRSLNFMLDIPCSSKVGGMGILGMDAVNA
ncbi:monooxygenase flavin dependent like protein [Zymoseptoria brevis]|uniref:Monooxygenase flavin dependent like protein n=1 Tax=Zymoseptoria brevis TaxID=1047168 RepID=A0A0F4GUY0_9PEZI|nr:monooxygenase flavin dependent like protein [Zymoseptoria brevis]